MSTFKKFFFNILALAALLALAACASATPPPPTATTAPTATPEPTPAPALTLSDNYGHTVTLAEPPQKILSLAPSNTEILFAIGAGSQVVGRDMFSDFPAEAQQLPDIGGGFNQLNTELIVSLAPDLVLAADLTPPEQMQALEDLGLKVFALDNPRELEGMYQNLALVGQLTGHETEAAALVDSLKERVAAVEAKIATVSERPLVFYELDSTDVNAPWTAGPGTFIDTLINMSGGENVGQTLQGDWVQISVEALLVADPDLIVLGDATWGGVTPEDVYARTSWADLTAVKEKRVYTFDDNLVSRPGPRMVDGLEAMARLLHPELFP